MVATTFARRAAVAAAVLVMTGCTMHKQEAPSLTGPSQLGTLITVSVSPDVLRQDGASQSLVTVQAANSTGAPLSSVTLRAEIQVAGASADFGSLSARNVVTDSGGRATFVYTAPPSPATAVDTGTVIQIAVTPVGSDYANAVPRTASIRLVPPGVVGLPQSPLVPEFAPPFATAGDVAVFQATVVDALGANATSQVTSFAWDFGDGSTGSGQNTTHTYRNAGTYLVRLTITDSLGRASSVSHSVTVAAGQNPTAIFTVSPSGPRVNQAVNFNASASTASTGHRITDFRWDFGDGTGDVGASVSHAFTQTGIYTVLLRVTDDLGRQATTTQTVTVGNANLTPDFTINPSAPRGGQAVTFDASPSSAGGGRSIASYSWIFDDGTTGSGKTVTHAFTVVTTQTFTVRLTITDDLGQTATITKTVTVSP